MEQQKNHRKNYWECKNEADLYDKLIGRDYGSNPVLEKQKIVDDKIKIARWIKQYIPINSQSVGLEIGTGSGFIIKEMATFSKFVYGTDISQSFLDYAQKECAEVKNTSFHLIAHAEFPFLAPDSLDFAYSNNVFIHLDLYEITDYLEALFPLLKNGAQFWFDILDSERIASLDDADFLETRNYRKKDPFCKTVLQFNSAKTISKLASLMGYKVSVPHQSDRCNTKFLLQKHGRKS